MKFLRLATALITPFVLAATLTAQSLEVQLQRAVQRELATGDHKAAIAEYRRIADRAGANRAVTAQALLRLADSHRDQGDAEAGTVYQQIVSRFADQAEIAAIAQRRLATSRTLVSTGIAKRRVWYGRDAERAAGDARVSPDGRFIAFVPTDSTSLVLRDLNGHTERTLVRASFGQSIPSFAWSRDGARVAFRVWEPGGIDEVRTVTVEGATSRTLATKPAEFRSLWVLDWASDGRLLVGGPLANTDRLRLAWVSSVNGAFQPLTEFQVAGVFDAQVSPDGTTVVFGGIRAAENAREIHLIASDGSGRTVLSADQRDDYPAGWLPDSHGVLIVSRRGAKVGLWALQVLGGAVSGEARLVEQDLCSCGELVDLSSSGGPVRTQAQVETLGVTARGDVFFRMQRLSSDIYIAPVDARGANAALVPLKVSRNGNNIRPQWSPDGRRILLAWNSTSQRQHSVIEVNTGIEQRLPVNGLVAAGHCWAGNDAIHVFQRPSGAGPSQFTRVNLATRDETILFEEPLVRDTSCSADGRIVGYAYYPSTDRLYFRVRNLNTGSTVDVPLPGPGPVDATTISPDGRQVAFSAPISNSLFVAQLDGGAVREIVKVTAPQRFLSGAVLAWSPDSQYVYYVKRMNGTSDSEVFRVRAAGGPEERLGISGPDLRNLNVSPDGTQIALAMGPRNRPEIWAIENTAAPAAK
jgi:Tol biopolymer transport system component